MSDLLRSRLTSIWFLLVAATIASWALGHGFGIHDHRIVGVIVIIVALVKVRFVLLDFMELRHAPNWMRIVAEAWAAMLAIALSILSLTE
ncbi:MAG: cytochrome C oxidase subunit IV family protein [Rudaea sp.]|uniref:cytochrome C oxidase subunit IV family protein n=1 Tax=Rudaea sp. TaxID=2136325 RepID=UPI0039E4A6F1